MRKLLFIFSILIAITFSSCRKDFTFEQSTGGLEFSKSTVYLDTIFETPQYPLNENLQLDPIFLLPKQEAPLLGT